MSKHMAGIVLYNAEIERLSIEIKSVLPQVDLICLCDNGSLNIKEIERLIEDEERIVLIRNEKNLGIGVASNQICKYAEQNGFDWVLMLDHDTVCPSNLVSTYKEYTADTAIGMMCPNVVDLEIVNNSYCSANTVGIEYIDRCIQSATFIRTGAWKKCQGFNEWMFIDFVDFDFCKRMELAGFRIMRCNTVTVDHQLGKRVPTKHADFFRRLFQKTDINLFKYLTYENEFSAARVFYCTRNNIAYIKEYRNSIDVKKEWKDFWLRIIRRLLRSKNRRMIFCETIKGIRAGIRSDIRSRK